jgi:uncharacterized membrane protein
METIDIVSALSRWIHFMAGIMWIGLLYYFNFVQVAALKIAGAALLGPYFMDAFLLRNGMGPIGIGAWLGTIMLFNVWVLIWPNQKKILGMTPASDDEKNKARRVAFLASRTNTMLSIPMLFFMATGMSHSALFSL